MEKNLFLILMSLFILSACQPSPGGQGQAATATQAAAETFQPTVTPTSKLVVTTSEIHENLDPLDYPHNAMNLILDSETSDKQIEKIINSDNSYYYERLSVNLEEIKFGIGLSQNDYEPLISVYPSKDDSIEAWSLVMRDKRNGDLLIPARSKGDPFSSENPFADLIISPSETKDTINLVRINADGKELKIIFDKSKWPIIVTGDYTKWYDLGYAPIGWKNFSNSQADLSNVEEDKKENEIIISTDIENMDSWPVITIEQLPEYREKLREYVDKNKLFPDNAINFGAYRLDKDDFVARIFFDYAKKPEARIYRSHPEMLPKKTFAYAILEWRIFNSQIHKSIMASQVWLDEENNPSIILNYIEPCDNNVCPTENFLFNKEELINKDSFELNPFYFTNENEDLTTLSAGDEAIYKARHLEIFDVKDLLEKWIEEQRIPKDLDVRLSFFPNIF